MFVSGLMVKKISSCQMPDRYRNEAEKYLEEAKAVFKEDLLLFMVTGSCALGFCIDGWSDINVLIVTKNFDLPKYKIIHNAAVNHSIHIVLTLLTRYEFENNLLDDETRVAVWQLNEKWLLPNFVRGGLNAPDIKIRDIQEDDKRMMPAYLHEIKNIFFGDVRGMKVPIIKLLYTIIKMELRRRGCVVYSYTGAVKEFAKNYNDQEFGLFLEISSRTDDPSQEFLVYAERVVRKICEEGRNVSI